MRGLVSFALLAVLGAGAAGPPTDPAAEELKALQGTWTLVGYEKEGKRQDRESLEEDWGKDLANYVLRVEGEKVFLGVGENVLELKRVKRRAREVGTYRLDATAKPKAFDACFPGDGLISRQWPVEGIYRLRGDRLELCVTALPDREPRPTEFKTVRTHWTTLYVFERARKPEK
jgi:uncharacterized protein (TIGR03067 family)